MKTYFTTKEVKQHLKQYAVKASTLPVTIKQIDRVIWDDAIHPLILECSEVENTYNDSLDVVFRYQVLDIDGMEYIAVTYHNGGDVRSNYGVTKLYDLNLEEFYELLCELRMCFEMSDGTLLTKSFLDNFWTFDNGWQAIELGSGAMNKTELEQDYKEYMN